MRFLVDMNLPPGIASWLRQEGHDAAHALDLGYAELADRDIFGRAGADTRIVITLDLDFGEIAVGASISRTGVILLRLRRVHQQYIRERCGTAIAQAGEALERGAVVIVEDSRLRIRSMPPERP